MKDVRQLRSASSGSSGRFGFRLADQLAALIWLLLLLSAATESGCATSPDRVCRQICRNIIPSEQRTIDYRDPAQIPPAPIPDSLPPRTVANPQPETGEWLLSLDEAIRISLENAKIIRILAGTTATASGQTIYDPAITNTTIDQARAVFDPNLTVNNQWSRNNAPSATIDPFDFTRTDITSTPTDQFVNTAGLTKNNVLGGQWALTSTETVSHFSGPNVVSSSLFPVSTFPLNPESSNTVQLSYTQPLLKGAGFQVNMAPIVIARINTEQSFFQYKDSTQEMVRGAIEAYWNLVEARTAAWAAKIQVRQSKEAYDREQARLKSGLADLSNVAQARVTYNQFRASLVAADANVLTREGALRNLLGLSPSDGRRIVPTSLPTVQRLEPSWAAVVKLAEQRRPDIIELKLIDEADKQRLLQAENQTQPSLNAVSTYSWNGLSGTMPNGQSASTGPGQYTDWSVAVNFTVPLGLRAARAGVRQQKLILERDQANIDQGLHAAIHELAATIRDMDGAYEQYLAYKETRVAAYENLKVQIEQFNAGRSIYLTVLQALNDWGNAITSEAQQLLTYNVTLANLERQTGTILETHGLVFYEERFRAAGPLLVPCADREYPFAVVPGGSPSGYPGSTEPSENAFDLRDPTPRRSKTPDKPQGPSLE